MNFIFKIHLIYDYMQYLYLVEYNRQALSIY